jgi:glycine cleavage system H protein
VYAPISGTVFAVNEALEEAPETVNSDAYADGWFFKMQPADVGELEELLDAEAYGEVCEAEEH